MKLYPHRDQEACQRIYSYRVSRTRRIIENVFGLLHKRFVVLRKTINLASGKEKIIVLAIIALHNILRKLDSNVYIRDELPHPGSREDSWIVSLVDMEDVIYEIPAPDAKSVRSQYEQYFMYEGSVPFQSRICGSENNK